MEKQFESDSPNETFDAASEFGAELEAGDIVLFYGSLGAGKTLFTKGILSALGFDVDEVNSPSFSLVNRYETANGTVFHLDLWRVEGGQDVPFAVGLDEILEDTKAIVIVEWAEKLEDLDFGRTVKTVKIQGNGEQSRVISIGNR